MGSATFALPSLKELFEIGHPIAGVITQPDKPSGRGQLMQGPPVKKFAFDLHLPVYQPNSLKSQEAHDLLNALAPDLIVVVAYGKILPRWWLQFPKYGCINLHGSLLPKFRGASPVHWAVANGEGKTGVCTMQLNEGLDTGPVYLCDETRIGPNETATELYDRLAVMGAPLVLKTLAGIVSGTLKPKPQDDSRATYAPMLQKKDGFIDWSRPAREIHNRVRAFNPWPGTVTKFRGQTCKILKTAVEAGPGSAEPGIIGISKGRLIVECGAGAVEVLSIQPQSRKAIGGADFANGNRIQPGEKFIPISDNEKS